MTLSVKRNTTQETGRQQHMQSQILANSQVTHTQSGDAFATQEDRQALICNSLDSMLTSSLSISNISMQSVQSEDTQADLNYDAPANDSLKYLII